jgi:energy-coupling factor transporter transmembrane protein EcfT
MLCRGFNGTFYSLKSFSWQRRDGFFLGASVLALIALLCLELLKTTLLRGPL